MERRRIAWGGAAAALLAIGLAARLWHVAAEPLWLDEAYSIFAADRGFAFIWQVTPGYEVHPPFYYSLLRLWTLLFGDGLVALRALGLAAGIAVLPVVAAAAGEAGRLIGWDADRRRLLRLAAFALACLSLSLVEMTRQVRPYPVMILVYAAATWAVIRLARRARDGRAVGGRGYLGYLLLLEAMLWLHSLGLLYGAALVLALGAGVLRRGLGARDWAVLAGGHLLVLVGYLPALAILLDQAPTWERSTWLRFQFHGLPERLAAIYAVPDWPGLAALALVVLAFLLLVRSGPGRRLAAMLAMLALLPVAASILLSVTRAPVFLPRVMTSAAVPALLLFAIGATAFAGTRRRIGFGALAILLVNMIAVDWQARAAGPMEHWYEAVAWLRPRFRPGDQIFAYPNEAALPMARALRDQGLAYPIRAIPMPVPASDPAGWRPTGSRGVVSLPRWRLRQIADEPATRAVPTVWLLRLGAPLYDRGDAFVEELHRSRVIVRSFSYESIQITGLARR